MDVLEDLKRYLVGKRIRQHDGIDVGHIVDMRFDFEVPYVDIQYESGRRSERLVSLMNYVFVEEPTTSSQQ